MFNLDGAPILDRLYYIAYIRAFERNYKSDSQFRCLRE